MRPTWRMSAGPSRRVLGALVLLVLLAHAWLLVGVGASLDVRLGAAQPPVAVQMRVLASAAPVATAVRPAPRPAPRGPAAVAAPAQTQASVPDETQPPPPVSASVPEPAASEPAAPVLAQAAAPGEAAPQAVAPSAAAASGASASVPESASPGTTVWPLVPLGALPPSRVLSYRLHGMDKGLSYFASGELRWQHNDREYDLTLSVRAFLLGRRQWRSVGRIGPTGLEPRRLSDSWRNERAAHFDREQQRIVFSSNNRPAALQPGAQDQVSLYVQLAAAMAGEPERFAPGTRLQVQTATIGDAEPWSMVLEGTETLTFDGQGMAVSKWVCQPRNRFDNRVEFWVAASQAWLPVRIRITQASGSYIDLEWRGTEPLAPLPAGNENTTAAGAS